MRAQPQTMTVSFHSPMRPRQAPPPALPQSPGVEDYSWDGLTLRELVGTEQTMAQWIQSHATHLEFPQLLCGPSCRRKSEFDQ